MGMGPDDQHTAVGELALRTFGPVADTLGIELAKLPPFVARNLSRVAAFFTRKAGADDAHALSTRLLRQVIDEAMYSDEDIVAEYLSGVMASSMDVLKSDRGVTITALIRRLSAVQLRVHYIFYAELWRHRVGKPVDLRWQVERARLHVEFQMDEFMRGLGVESLSEEQRREIVGHAILGLAREQLIDEDSWEFIVRRGEPAPLAAHADTDREPMVSFHPSPLGAELFLWGCGSPSVDQRRLLDPALELVLSDVFPPLASTEIDDRTTSSDVVMELELARSEARWNDIGYLLATPVALPEDVHHFYSAIASHFLGDPHASRSSMFRSWECVTSEHKKQGLRTLGQMRSQHPDHRQALWILSEILATGRISGDEAE